MQVLVPFLRGVCAVEPDGTSRVFRASMSHVFSTSVTSVSSLFLLSISKYHDETPFLSTLVSLPHSPRLEQILALILLTELRRCVVPFPRRVEFLFRC